VINMGGRVVAATLALLAAALALVATRGLVAAAAALVVAIITLVLAVLGRERTATLFMAGAFATAPAYRGLLPDLPATPTDLLLVLATMLLLPELLSRTVRLPAAFVLSLGALFAFGLRSSAASSEPLGSLFLLALWMLCAGVVPLVIALWRPGPRVVQLLLWSYLSGHMVSTAYALLEGPAPNNRYDGLTHHPNALGIAGAVSVAIVFYLWTKHRDTWIRVVLAGVILVSGVSVLMSGSRAATVVVVALVILVPAVERSAMLGLVVAAVAGLSLAFLPVFVDASGEGSSLSRLVGDATAQSSDTVREDALEEGKQMFEDAPILGSGLSIELGEVHNLYLEVAIAVGILGSVAYFVLLYVLARPLFGRHPDRRLAYFAWVFIIIGPVVPALTDRTMLLPMGLAILPALGAAASRQGEQQEPTPGPLEPARAGG
jgi:O-antigen ligase